MFRTKRDKRLISGDRLEAVARAILPTLMKSHKDMTFDKISNKAFDLAEEYFDVMERRYSTPRSESSKRNTT